MTFHRDMKRKTQIFWQISFLIFVAASQHYVFADPGEQFLNTIIERLRQEKQQPRVSPFFRDEHLRATSRSAEEYQIHEAQESSENSIYQPNNEFDQSQNYQIFEQQQQQFVQPLQYQADFATGNDLSQSTVSAQNPQVIGLQQFNVNGYLSFLTPKTGLSSSTEPATPQHFTLLRNTGPHLFHAADPNQAQFAVVPIDVHNPQTLTPNIQNQGTITNGGDGSGVVSQNNEPVAPTYYFYNPVTTLHSVDDNHLIDDAMQAMKPLQADDLMAQQPGKKFVVEPLFVAMAGFVGIAMIFMGAVLFLPKIVSPPPRVSSLKGPQELAALTKLAVETIEGKDCTERIACEVGRAMRNMQVGSKPIRVLEILLPEHLAKQLAQIRKAVANRKACRLIQCKRLITSSSSELRPKTAENKFKKTNSGSELTLSKITTKSPEKKEPREESDMVTVITLKAKTKDKHSTSKPPSDNRQTDKGKKGEKKSPKPTTNSPKIQINQTKTPSTEYPIILSFIPSF